MTLLRKKNEGIKKKLFIYIFKNEDNTFFKRKIILKNDCHFSYVFKEEFWHTVLVQPNAAPHVIVPYTLSRYW